MPAHTCICKYSHMHRIHHKRQFRNTNHSWNAYHTHTRTKNATEKLAENTNLGINSTKKFKSKCPEGCVVSMSYLCMHKAINIIQKIISWCPRQEKFLVPKAGEIPPAQHMAISQGIHVPENIYYFTNIYMKSKSLIYSKKVISL